MKNKKIILLLVASLLFSIILTGCGGEEANEKEGASNDQVQELLTLDKIRENGRLVMGTSADYPPFEFHSIIDGKDEIVGLDVEIANYIANELGVELEIKEMDFNNLLGGISTGMLDVVLAGMNPNPERKEEASFTDLYYEANLSVLVHKDREGEIKLIDDMEGKSIGVQIGTTQEDIANDIKDSDVKSLKTNPDIVMNLKTNKIDCAIMENPVAEAFAKVNDDIVLVEGLTIQVDSGGIAIATQKGNDELVDKLNEIIGELKEKGLIDKWLIEAKELNDQSL